MFDIGWKIFAHPVNLEDSLIGTFMGIFLFVASMFSFVMTVRPAPSLLYQHAPAQKRALTTMGTNNIGLLLPTSRSVTNRLLPTPLYRLCCCGILLTA